MVMHDVDQELTANGEFLPWLYSQHQPVYDLAYADDTALIAGTAKSAEQLLHTLQKVGNLHLNLKKCVLLRSPTSHNTVHFTNGTPLTIEQHAKYLGVTLGSDGSSLAQGRPSHVSQKHANTSTHYTSSGENTDFTLKWKLRIYNAVLHSARNIRAYGLESAALTKGDFGQIRSLPLTESAKDTPLQKHLLHRGAKSHSPYLHQSGGESTHLTAPPHTAHPQSTAEAYRAHSSIPSEQYRTELLFY